MHDDWTVVIIVKCNKQLKRKTMTHMLSAIRQGLALTIPQTIQDFTEDEVKLIDIIFELPDFIPE